MAQDDNGQHPRPRGPPPGATAPPDHVNKPQVYEIFHGSKPDNRDGIPPTTPGLEGQQGENRRPTFVDGVKSIKAEDLLAVPKIPCARQGLLMGIGGGAGIGMIRYILGARIPKAANWACGTFIIGSIVQFEFCRYQRIQERVAMARVVEVVDRKQAEKKQRAEDAARKRAEAVEKARQEAMAANESWFKFWQR